MPYKDRETAQLIFLIGMPAVGKTYWGNAIAGHYTIPFIDLDVYITEQEKASVQALFAQYGEAGFREREHKYLKQIISAAKEDTIIACGGGTPCFNDNLQLMKRSGTVIYLRSDVGWLMNNLKQDHIERPLLRNREKLPEYLDELLEKRKPWYEQADHILQAADISLSTFDKIISL